MNLFKSLKRLVDRARGRYPLELLKHLELEVMGKHASTYCYHHPSHALIELTTRCNLRCQWCNQNDEDWQKEYGHNDMPFELFDRIVRDLEGSRVLLLYNIGEPLLYKRIYDAIRTARRYIPEVRITSNAMLLDAKAARRLEEAGLTRLNVSIDSPDHDLMGRIRSGSNLKTIEENIRGFGEVCTIPIEIWSVISDANVESLERLPDWASQFSAIKSIYFQLQNGVENGQELGLPPLGSEARFRGLQAVVGKRCRELQLKTNIEFLPYYPKGFQERQAVGICKAPFTQLVAISVEGKLAPCCSYGTLSLGDVGRDGFSACWNGAEMRAWREDMLNQHYCAYCSEWCGYRQAGTGEKAFPVSIRVE